MQAQSPAFRTAATSVSEEQTMYFEFPCEQVLPLYLEDDRVVCVAMSASRMVGAARRKHRHSRFNAFLNPFLQENRHTGGNTPLGVPLSGHWVFPKRSLYDKSIEEVHVAQEGVLLRLVLFPNDSLYPG